MSDIYYFSYLSGKVHEGGMARNYAFFIKLKSLTKNIYNIYNKNKFIRLFYFFRTVLILLFVKKKKIFLHQGSIPILFPLFLFKFKKFRKVFHFFLKFIAKRNNLFVEVNDLPYEQAIDLQLDVKVEYLFMEDIIYSLKNVNYIFASNQMNDYVQAKYNINSSLMQVIINGGPKLNLVGQENYDILKQNDKMKYIYAGSLNEGRNIKDIISLFKEKNNVSLILIGSDGNWLENYSLPKNIFYLGNFEEDEAHRITALCDIGLLPYDDSKFYYNLCYPTKVSFYITAGIPVLSTPLRELQNVFNGINCIDFLAFNDWKTYIDNSNDIKFKQMKAEAEYQISKFSWSSILDSLKI